MKRLNQFKLIREVYMSDVFVPLDLSRNWNSSTKNVETPKGFLWPYQKKGSNWNGLRDLPAGHCRFWGIPFHMADHEVNPDALAFVTVASGVGEEVPELATIQVGMKACRVLFAHICSPFGGEWTTLEGTGEEIGSYRVVLEDGTKLIQKLRRRFEIHDLTIPWGHHPFLCRHCREFISVPLDQQSDEWGRVQTGVTKESNELGGWWLFDWQNPTPDVVIDRIEVFATGNTAIALGGITLCQETSDPFAWPPREEVVVSVKDKKEVSPKVEMERGVVVREGKLFIPNADFLTTGESGWGIGGQNVKEKGYLEIHGSTEGKLLVGAKNGHKESFRWGDVLEKKTVNSGPVRVELVSPRGKQWVRVRVEDGDTRMPVGTRIHFRSSHGVYFAPHGHQADVNTGWFEDVGGDCKVRGTPYAYIDGKCQIELPIGPVFIEVVRGFEYTPLRCQIEVKPGQRDLTLKIGRKFDMKEKGFYSGDTHVHFLSAQSSYLEAAAEDLNVVNLLASQWGRLFTSWEEFTGGLSPTSNGDHLIWVSQENRQHVLGHISLLGLKEQVSPICTGGPQEDWVGGEVQALLADWAEACKQQGGLVIMPHIPTPDFENAANIVLGHADAAEMCWIWQGEQIGAGERGYYRWLNTGQRLPIVGGTDKMSNERVLGGSRTYAKLLEGEPFTYENWCRAVKRGTTFASTGAMIDLWADGVQMGGKVELPGNGGIVEVIATAESVWPLAGLELIVNGRRVAKDEGGNDRSKITVKFNLKADRSCWVVARCWSNYRTDAGPVMAHSSPVYIDVGGRCAFDPQDGQYLLTHMEGGISWAERIGVFRDEKIRSRLIALFREAQDELNRRA